MGILKLAAQLIDFTKPIAHWGHLQIVNSALDQEIEVQAPIGDYLNEIGFFGFAGLPRSHSDLSNTPHYGDPINYRIVNIDVGDRNGTDVWDLLAKIHGKFQMESPNFQYTAGQNSNSYAATLLWMVGINVNDYIADVTPPSVVPPGQPSGQPLFNFTGGFPGVDRNILTNGYGVVGGIDFDLTLTATDADDFLRTGNGEDKLSGLAGKDKLYGGAGNDELKGGNDDDQLFGQDDNDTLIGGRGSDLLDGGEGYDTADYSAAADPDTTGRASGITVTQNAHAGTGSVNDGLGGTDTLVSIEFVNGTSFDDSFAVTGSLAGVGGNTQLQFDGGTESDHGDTINLSGVTSGGLTVVLETAGDSGYATHSTGFPGYNSGDAQIAFGGIENVVGTDSTDTITGNDAANILYGGEGADKLTGGAGDDILVFDAADTTVEGGAGRDVGIVTGEAGVTVDLAAQGLEVVVGGEGADNFTLNGQGDAVQMVAGGGGVDTFTINTTSTSGPVVVWGGDGADKFMIENGGDYSTGVMTVSVEGLTADNFADFNLDMLGLGNSFNWDAIDLVVLNPDASDEFYTNSERMGVESGFISITELNTNNNQTFIAYAEGMTLVAGMSDQAVGNFDVGFLNNGTMSVQTSVGVVTATYLQPINPDTDKPYPRGYSIYGPDDPDTPEYEGDPFPNWDDLQLSSADATATYDFPASTDIDAVGDRTNAFYWINYESPNAPVWNYSDGPNPYGFAPGVDNLSDVGTLHTLDDVSAPWFVVGGNFDSLSLASDNSISVTMPSTPPSFSLTEWLASISGSTGGGGNSNSSTNNINSGSGATTILTFNVSNNYLIYDGNAVDPTDTGAGFTVSQVGANVEIDFGNGDVVTLQNTSLTDWQTAAATQSFGSAGDDVLTGAAQGETFVSGAGNDVINGASGDDTIVYTSGDDVITGHGTNNYGNDTLDLSKYTADQVSFRIVGHDVFIDTPDGTIELDYQVRYEVGHTRSNIENIIFSDGTLDEAGIADRAIADQATAGDDVITGSYVSDTISSGAGNDVINASSGDDTIVYTSGDDVITGHGTINYGNDTLDLSKYTADQVSFRIVGHDVFIDTPDGTIELDYQVRYDVGHSRSNIENIIFSDGTLDEAGIAGRAIADQATTGDDVITGSFQSETISGGTGNDILSGINGSDTFVFAVGDGVDHITDYNAANDTLEFTGISFADLTITQDGSDVVIEYGTSDQVIVENSVIANFNEPEFLFA